MSAQRDAESAEHAAAGEVAEQVDRRQRFLSLAPDEGQRAGDGDVVDVVAGHARIGTALSPARQPRIDQAGVAAAGDVGPEAEALHDPGPIGLEEDVRLLDQAQHGVHSLRALEVDADRALAARQLIDGAGADAVDAHDVGTEIGENQTAVRCRGQSGHLDDSNPLERFHADFLSVDGRMTRLRGARRDRLGCRAPL